MAKPGPKPKVEPTDALAVFDRREDRGEPLTASEVADALGCSRRTALNRLHDLADEGELRSKQVGGRSRVYWTPIDGEDENDSEGEDIAASGVSPAPAPEGIGVEFPVGRDRDECLAAVDAVCDYLREHGPASMREIVTDVMPKHPVGYDVPDLGPGDRYRGAWWRKVVKPGLETRSDVEKPSGGGKWRYVGES